MCTVLLPPGDNPIAVNKYIIYHITYHIIKQSGAEAKAKQAVTEKRM